MLNRLFQTVLHSSFVFTRPVTLGARGLVYDKNTNSVLLVRHSYSDGWELPGGGIAVGESTLEGLKRELLEETGVNCESANIVWVYHNKSVSKRDHVALYLVEEWTKQAAPAEPNIEIVESKWFDVGGLPSDLTPCASYGINLLTSRCKAASASAPPVASF